MMKISPTVNADRMWNALMELARVGATPKGGNRRLALSALDGQGRKPALVPVAPIAITFVPCKNGISHNEIEDADPRHLEADANVLVGAMLTRAGAVL